MIAATRGYANIVEYLIAQRSDPNMQVHLATETQGGIPSELVRVHAAASPALHPCLELSVVCDPAVQLV